jgi:hypothetical protein
MTTANITTASMDEFLGPASGRFFGEGFKRIEQALTGVRVVREQGRGMIIADAALTYPADWSRKSARTLRPHLSSIDGLVLAVELAEAYLTHRYGLGLDERRRMWLRSFEMRVASPQEDLAEFRVQAVDTGCAAIARSHCEYVSTFDCQIGTIRVTCAIEHDIASRNPFGGRYESCDDILGDARRRHYGDAYKRRTHDIADVAVTRATESLTAGVTVGDSPDGGDDHGFAGAYQPSASMVDALLSMAQLSQVLAYTLDSVQRASSNTFWMRRLAFSAASPLLPLDARLDVSLGVSRGRLLSVGGGAWRALDLSGHFGEMSTTGSIAHALPDTSTASRAAA